MGEREQHRSYNGARVDLLKLGEYDFSGKSVLDIGCYRGANASYLKQNFEGVSYLGMEGDPEAVKQVYPEVDELHETDLDKADFSFLEGRRIDRVILGDVIEHLKEPDRFMSKLTRVLHGDTKVYVSIPNVQYYETFLLLAAGRFPRRERGIYDKTHLRWFTNREFRSMVGDEYEVLQFSRSFRLVDGHCCAYLNRFNRYAAPLFWLLAPFFTYQLYYVLQKKKRSE